ncbi:MAG TPA: potassium channel family protein [Candidatus Paceibacterota bacterium]
MTKNHNEDLGRSVIRRKHDGYHIFAAIFIIVFFITLGTVSFHILEDWSFAKSFYFSVATLTTVGYGDLHPTYDVSRTFAAFYILFGVGSTLAAITVIATDRINVTAARMRESALARKEKKEE